MLRGRPLKSFAGLKKYFQILEQADYFSEKGNSPGQWQSFGSFDYSKLGLFGAASPETLDIFRNINPATGERLTGNMREDRRVGMEFTTSVPKSVTVARRYFSGSGDLVLADAIKSAEVEANRDMLALMATYMQARVRSGGKDEDRITGNMVALTYFHPDARPSEFPDYFPEASKKQRIADPHDHFHNLVPNSTFDFVEGKRGKWKAAQFGLIAEAMPFFQAFFDDRLASKLQALGIATERKGLSFEIKGVERETIDKFSRRTLEIEAEAKKRGITSDELKDKLGQRTRVNKDEGLSPAETNAFFMARLSDEEKARFEAIKGGGGTPPPTMSHTEALDYAVKHAFANESVIPDHELLAHALLHSVGSGLSYRMREALEEHKEVIRGRDLRGHNVVTAQHVLAEEESLLEYMRDARARVVSSFAEVGAERGVRPWEPGEGFYSAGAPGAPKELSYEQKAVVAHVLASNSKVIGIRGVAGGGKTTTMRETVAAIRALTGKDVVTVAPTGMSAREEGLRKEGFKEADTLTKLIGYGDGPGDRKMQEKARGGVIYVDEAGLVGAEAMLKLFRLADALGARVILQGDTRQHASVARGDAMRLLEEHGGLTCAEITEIRRQKHAPHREAVGLLAAGDIAGGFDKLHALGGVKEVKDSERYKIMAEDYLDALKAAPENAKRTEVALVITPAHGEGRKAAKEIRKGMWARGMLEDEREQRHLTPLGWSDAQREAAYNYERGHVVEFGKNATGGFVKGERYHVRGVVDGEVILSTAKDGAGPVKVLPRDHSDRFDVFREDVLPLAVGDLVRITKGGSDSGGKALETGAIYEVRGYAKDGSMQLGTEPGKVSRTLDTNKALHLRHGYYRTSYEVQGATTRRAIVGQSSESFGASNEKQAMVSWSRFTESMTIYTDDVEATRRAAQRSGEREFARNMHRARVAAPKPAPEAASPPKVAARQAEGFRRVAPLQRADGFKRAEGFKRPDGFGARVREVYERIREEYEAARKAIKRVLGLEDVKAILPEPAIAVVPGFAAREALRREKARDGPER